MKNDADYADCTDYLDKCKFVAWGWYASASYRKPDAETLQLVRIGLHSELGL